MLNQSECVQTTLSLCLIDIDGSQAIARMSRKTIMNNFHRIFLRGAPDGRGVER